RRPVKQAVISASALSLLRVQEAQRRSRNDGLLHRAAGVLAGLVQELRRVGAVAKRARGQARQLAGVTVGERDRHAAGAERLEPVDRIRGKAGLSLLPV